ncbi:hypothetical protein [Caballeronia novacaledonica]|uniref:Uncharacterized protein n=1 Tax=Caballeronia novacaledonica TaxID=1544861 RepID=A0AA37IF94_9BURK|nr:hypothetical protein [Caballeronia novacaledonica]GJH28791.1 hypothetical protein CBA19CS42_29765 [Caballeronia novacaledonica]
MADIIAAGGLVLLPRINEKSFISRAKNFLGDSEARLEWGSGDNTSNGLTMTDMEDVLDHPHIQYMSQQFVDQLCSADGPNDELVDDIERVISTPIHPPIGTGQSASKNFLPFAWKACGRSAVVTKWR